MPEATNTHERIKHAVVLRLQELALEGIETRVYSQLLPDETNVSWPAFFVTTEGERESEEWSTNQYIGIWYPVRVFIADKADRTRHEKEAKYLAWRKAALDAFRTERLLNAAEVRSIKIEPEVIFDPKLQQYQHMISGFVLRCWAAMTRTFT